jgi:hypothetical protein
MHSFPSTLHLTNCRAHLHRLLDEPRPPGLVEHRRCRPQHTVRMRHQQAAVPAGQQQQQQHLLEHLPLLNDAALVCLCCRWVLLVRAAAVSGVRKKSPLTRRGRSRRRASASCRPGTQKTPSPSCGCCSGPRRGGRRGPWRVGVERRPRRGEEGAGQRVEWRQAGGCMCTTAPGGGGAQQGVAKGRGLRMKAQGVAACPKARARHVTAPPTTPQARAARHSHDTSKHTPGTITPRHSPLRVPHGVRRAPQARHPKAHTPGTLPTHPRHTHHSGCPTACAARHRSCSM